MVVGWAGLGRVGVGRIGGRVSGAAGFAVKGVGVDKGI
jgi:hypothetical protein